MRALEDRAILQQVRVLSTVSGGSIIGAMYAYGGYACFAEFEEKVLGLLRSGLHKPILKAAALSRETPRLMGTIILNGGPTLLLGAARKVVGASHLLLGSRLRALEGWLDALENRLPHWGSLTTALEHVLRMDIFGDVTLGKVPSTGLRVVINASELRTGTALRFGSDISGAWRYGAIVDGSDVKVATAVAASAAFPLLLPPLVREFQFNRRGVIGKKRVFLADGGVIDNLGLGVLEPGRSGDFSVNVYEPTHIIASNAGRGQFPIGSTFYWAPSRLRRSFETIYRKAQDAAYSRLHRFVEQGELSGFALIYLGQDDSKLPVRPADLVPREAVRDYATDFAAMSQKDIALLAARGEQLTRLMVSRYLPEL
jgi:NTE family protein